MARRGRRRRRRHGLRLRDRFFQRPVAAAITSPAGIVAGSALAAVLIASGAPFVAAGLVGVAAWSLPVARAMRRVPGFHGGLTGRARTRPPITLVGGWADAVADAEQALARYQAALDRCADGPLKDRLVALEDEVAESVDACHELAQWGADAELARRELDPAGMERAARRSGRAAIDAATSQRQLVGELLEVEADCRARLALINGRLDEAVGRAVELAGEARRDLLRSRSVVDHESGDAARAVAEELRALRAALDEMDGPTGATGTPPERRAAPG